MLTVEKRMVAIFVDRACRQNWIVRDPDGNFWLVPPGENPWENRQPFDANEDSDLEPIPGHYKYLLNLPF